MLNDSLEILHHSLWMTNLSSVAQFAHQSWVVSWYACRYTALKTQKNRFVQWQLLHHYCVHTIHDHSCIVSPLPAPQGIIAPHQGWADMWSKPRNTQNQQLTSPVLITHCVIFFIVSLQKWVNDRHRHLTPYHSAPSSSTLPGFQLLDLSPPHSHAQHQSLGMLETIPEKLCHIIMWACTNITWNWVISWSDVTT